VSGTKRTAEGSEIRIPNRDALRSRFGSGAERRTSTTTVVPEVDACASLISPGITGVVLPENWPLVVLSPLLQPVMARPRSAAARERYRMLSMSVLRSVQGLGLAVDEVVHHHDVSRRGHGKAVPAGNAHQVHLLAGVESHPQEGEGSQLSTAGEDVLGEE